MGYEKTWRFSLIHAELPCTEYSLSKNTETSRYMEAADCLVAKTLEFFAFYGPNGGGPSIQGGVCSKVENV